MVDKLVVSHETATDKKDWWQEQRGQSRAIASQLEARAFNFDVVEANERAIENEPYTGESHYYSRKEKQAPEKINTPKIETLAAYQNGNDDNLDSILAHLTVVSDQAIDDRFSIFRSAEDFSIALTAAEIEAQGIELVIYCSKTGQPIDEISHYRFGRLFKMYGKEKTIDIIKRLQLGKTAEHWLYTDGESLAKLSEIDPRGYFVYAVSALFRPLQGYCGVKLNDWNEEFTARHQWTMAKHLLWKNTQECDVKIIIEANEMLRRFLGLFHMAKLLRRNLSWHEVQLPNVSPHLLINDLKKNISAILAYEAKKGRIKKNPSLAEINELKVIYQGHSNFRQQRRLKNMSELERIMIDLAEFMPDDSDSVLKRENEITIRRGKIERMLLAEKVKFRAVIPQTSTFSLAREIKAPEKRIDGFATLAERLKK